MSENKIEVLILIGSESDHKRIEKLAPALEWFGISHELKVSSAHRNPELTVELARKAHERGVKIIIAAAGMAAHLPGVIAAHTPLPVIGVPLDASPLKGVDALYSIVQMPPGVPVAAVGIDAAVNAAVLAAKILALNDERISHRLDEFIKAGCKIPNPDEPEPKRLKTLDFGL
ncbi:5-(carboxyamino)imidazole ribonucleotide mutase [bacterium]|nr:5-(carboxyamino)imidazole ribonucleotide mutase [FCB group bacterium]MBL7190779.1 5-(carboxyamino)imidazole ribonucleotide mutase [bacterium]